MQAKRHFFTCACGKVHEIKKGEPIFCQSKGHTVFRAPEYHADLFESVEQIKVTEPQKIKEPYQKSLF